MDAYGCLIWRDWGASWMRPSMGLDLTRPLQIAAKNVVPVPKAVPLGN